MACFSTASDSAVHSDFNGPNPCLQFELSTQIIPRAFHLFGVETWQPAKQCKLIKYSQVRLWTLAADRSAITESESNLALQ